jgi:cellulose synthase operon protein B
MRRIVPVVLLLIAMLLVGAVGMRQPARAQPPQPTPTLAPTVSVEDPGDTLPFTLLDFAERKLIGPADRTDYYFSLPEEWALTDDGRLNLELTVMFSGTGLRPEPGLTVGSLIVSSNYTTLKSIPLVWRGDEMQPVNVRLPYPVLRKAVVDDGRQVISLELDAGINCDFDTQTAVVIHPTSSIVLPYTQGTPPTNLALLPRPIYQQTFRTDRATLVVPDQPGPQEIRAALITAAGFGRMSRGRLDLSLTTLSGLQPEVRDTTHLIMVGKPANLPPLADLDLPLQVRDRLFKSTGVMTDDGVLQMVVSPWNRAKVVLVVSGNSGTGVVKAAQAISTGSLRNAVSIRPDFFVVADVLAEVVQTNIVPEDRTFAELGYQTETRFDRGEDVIEYVFHVPPGYVASIDSYLDLVFNHSALLNYEQSGMSVQLNDEYIGSIKFSAESTEVSTERISIPPSAVRIGDNLLQITVVMRPEDECIDPALRGIWAKVWAASLLHMPLTEAKEEEMPQPDLSQYPEFLLSNPTLQTTTFVLPPDNAAAWDVAATLAFHLGVDLRGDIAEPAAAYAQDIPPAVRQQQHLLVVGRATELPIIQELNDLLPLPFEAGSDLARTQGARIIYRFPPELPVGYIQLVSLPWNSQRVALAVMGNSEAGLWSSAQALTDWELRGDMAGNFAFVNGQKVSSGDTRRAMQPEQIAATAVPTGTIEKQSVTTTLAMQATGPVSPVAEAQLAGEAWAEQNSWVVPMFLFSSALIVLIVLGVAISALWKRLSIYRVGKQNNEHDKKEPAKRDQQ